MNEDEIISFEALYESMLKCKKGVIWKDSVAAYCLHGIENTLKLEQQLKDGTYKQQTPKKIMLTHPKKREAVCISFKDRVYQRSLNDNIIYPIMTQSFINANCACQKGKGTDYARNLLEQTLIDFFEENGLNGWVLQCDIKHFYQSIKHSVAEELLEKKLPHPIYKRAKTILTNQYTGDFGYNPGSQIVQIIGISILDDLDHYIVEELKIDKYIRYMDDFVLIHKDRKYLEYCKEQIEKFISNINLQLHPQKTHIYRIGKGIPFLGFVFRLVKTGVVVKIVTPKNVKAERKKLKRMVFLAKDGKITKHKVDECFKAWKAHVQKGDSKDLIARMNRFYADLWKE